MIADRQPSAGWLGDPTGVHQWRYWDGLAWTEHVSDNGNVTSDPLSAGATEAESGGRDGWLAAAALLSSVIGVVGALLPALDGQEVGDPDSLAFRIGVPTGLGGAAVAVALGSRLLMMSSRVRAAPIASVVIGGIALFLTAALVFSG